MINLSTTTFFLIILLFIFYKYLLSPYIKYLKYVKYGEGFFFPLIGVIYTQNKCLKQNDDIFYYVPKLFENNKCPRLIVSNFGSRIVLELLDTDLIIDFYNKESERKYEKYSFLMKNFNRFAGKSFGLSPYQAWKSQRKILSGYFHYEWLSEKVIPCINDLTQKILTKEFKKNKQNIDLINVFQQITAQIIIQSFISIKYEEQDEKMPKFYGMSLQEGLAYILSKLSNQMRSLKYACFSSKYFELGLTSEDRQFNKQIIEFKNLVKSLIIKRINEINSQENDDNKQKKQDLIYYLKQTNQLNNIDIDWLVEEFIALYVGGMDTTGHLCGMLIYFLCQHPNVKEKLTQEVLQNEDDSAKGLQNLTYLNAFIKEGLRFYTPASFLLMREAQQDHYLKDIFIRKGTLVNVLLFGVHRNPKYYQNPNQFEPERWIYNQNSPESKTQNFLQYIPFSAGQRNCIGQHLAIIESRIILNYFLKNFDFKLDSDFKLIMHYDFMYCPKQKLKFNIFDLKK